MFKNESTPSLVENHSCMDVANDRQDIHNRLLGNSTASNL